MLLPPVLTWVSGGGRETRLSFLPPAQRMTKASSQKWEQGGQSESWVSQGPCEEGFTAPWIPLGWFSFCVVFTSNHKGEAVQVPTTSLAQVLTTLLIYYGQGDRVAGVTIPWTREETP